MEVLHPLTREVLDALNAHVAVLDEVGTVIAVNSGWRRFSQQNGGTSDYVGANYFAVCDPDAKQGERAALRVRDRLRRLIDGELSTFRLIYRCAARTFHLRATRVADSPARLLLAHEDITNVLEARRRSASIEGSGLADVCNEHATRVGQAYEELGQRLAAIALATHRH